MSEKEKKEVTTWADPDAETAKEESKKRAKTGKPEGKKPNPEQTIFSYLDKIVNVLERDIKSRNRLTDAIEKLVFDVKVDKVKKTVETKASTPEKKVESEAKPPVKVVLPPPKKVEKAKSTKSTVNDLQRVKDGFTAELTGLLIFEEEDDYVKIRTKAFLTGDNFPKVAAVVRELGGEYISAGKKSHFRVKKTA